VERLCHPLDQGQTPRSHQARRADWTVVIHTFGLLGVGAMAGEIRLASPPKLSKAANLSRSEALPGHSSGAFFCARFAEERADFGSYGSPACLRRSPHLRSEAARPTPESQETGGFS